MGICLRGIGCKTYRNAIFAKERVMITYIDRKLDK